jgi:hypothetical protein
MVGTIAGGLLLAYAAYLTVQGAREFRTGIATLKFKWTYPQLEAERSYDPISFWLLALAKLLIVATLGYFGICVVLSS